MINGSEKCNVSGLIPELQSPHVILKSILYTKQI